MSQNVRSLAESDDEAEALPWPEPVDPAQAQAENQAEKAAKERAEAAAQADRQYSGPRTLFLTYMGLAVNPATGKAMTRKAASAFAGVDVRTTRRWEKEDGDFGAAIQRAQRANTDAHKLMARSGVAALLNSALDAYAELLGSRKTPPTVRATLATKALEMLGASTVDAPAPAGADAWAMLLQQLAATPPTDEDED